MTPNPGPLPASGPRAYHRILDRTNIRSIVHERTAEKHPRRATGESGDESIAAEVMGMDEELTGALALIWKMTGDQRTAFIKAIDRQLSGTTSAPHATGETPQTA